ncbi:P12 family lipoprotein [Borreliella burgdorferi]|uniref:Putative lipoprotein n=4 Tax=Borreliella burgdorferi TaxID=139 RepID=A0A0H3C343_BORBZ|nr:P12 family lipoprotein [Borreliella burgdorferi]ACK75267.1 putative lipoprotein [Borreliella burgdorferi ZS7]ACN55530.1 putative lipoprotein [Borreliella burgdorferi WI91-23]ACN56169.1 putative lipoprotein [Borreliella burgdorferi CA-11.2A]ACN92078.1 putative lipoprotein [Borreliella burgdorferi 94a]ACO37826.1 putative lipoprotein [Borreliella burgdorferi Bol26]
MRKSLFLYALLMGGLMSCNLDSKLSSNKEQKNNNNVKEVSDSVQEDGLNDLYNNQEKQKSFTKNFGERKYEDLINPIEPIIPSESPKNKANIPNISIAHTEKKETKKENLIPSTNEEKEADEAIKYLEENILKNSKFSELIREVRVLKDEYALIKADLYDVIGKINNKKTSLMENPKNNRDKINKLTQLLQNNLKIDSELEKLINMIDMAENEISSAAFFFDNAQKRLKESIIKRLESKNNRSYALKLSRQALSDARSALSNLESFASKRIEPMVRKEEIKELIKHAKTVLESLNKK